jgi:hypothetical protein
MIQIREASFPEDQETVIDIFLEYVNSPTASLAYQNYETEFANLPGSYASPSPCTCINKPALCPGAISPANLQQITYNKSRSR